MLSLYDFFCVVSFTLNEIEFLVFVFVLKGLHMLAFLVEVLEKGMQQVQVPILNIIYCMLHYIDLTSPHAQPISSDLIRVIAKYLDVGSPPEFSLSLNLEMMQFLLI